LEDVDDGKEDEHGSAEASTRPSIVCLIYQEIGAQEAVQIILPLLIVLSIDAELMDMKESLGKHPSDDVDGESGSGSSMMFTGPISDALSSRRTSIGMSQQMQSMPGSLSRPRPDGILAYWTSTTIVAFRLVII
jgi:hypothetical protein